MGTTISYTSPISPSRWEQYDTEGKVRFAAPGLAYMPDSKDGDNWAPGWNNTYGSILGGKRYTCVYQGDNVDAWQLQLAHYTDESHTTVSGTTINGKKVVRGVGEGVSFDSGRVIAEHPYAMFDLSQPQYADLNNRVSAPFKGKKVCMPAYRAVGADGKYYVDGVPQYDVQPIKSERHKYCANYDAQAKKAGTYNVAHVQNTLSSSAPGFRCLIGQGVPPQPKTPLPYPK